MCIDDENGYSCRCPAGFSGKNCEKIVDMCSQYGHQCKNGATCIQGSKKGYFCQCPENFSGEFCDVPKKSCSAVAREQKIAISQVCKNGGKCEDVGDFHQCRCASGFSGDHCESEQSLCENRRCHNGGRCNEQTGRCDCLPAWTGLQCETAVNACARNPCKNFGECTDTPYDPVRPFVCSCLRGTSGDRCEYNENNCEDTMPDGELPCKGHGTCIDGQSANTLGWFECHCEDGYTGDRYFYFCYHDDISCCLKWRLGAIRL